MVKDRYTKLSYQLNKLALPKYQKFAYLLKQRPMATVNAADAQRKANRANSRSQAMQQSLNSGRVAGICMTYIVALINTFHIYIFKQNFVTRSLRKLRTITEFKNYR